MTVFTDFRCATTAQNTFMHFWGCALLHESVDSNGGKAYVCMYKDISCFRSIVSRVLMLFVKLTCWQAPTVEYYVFCQNSKSQNDLINFKNEFFARIFYARSKRTNNSLVIISRQTKKVKRVLICPTRCEEQPGVFSKLYIDKW